MNVCIVHDSQKGNGKQMAEKLGSELESLGAEVKIGHRIEISPETVASDPPDLLIIGTAVRRFLMSPPTKKWIAQLAEKLENRSAKISHTALFLTHMMPDAMVEGRVGRLFDILSEVAGIEEVYPDWLSGQVKNITGPFIDGTMEKVAPFAAKLAEWAQPKS